MVRAQPGERGPQLRRRLWFRALAGLAGEENAVPVRRQCRPQTLLGVPVAGGNVEVVDAPVERRGHLPVAG